MQLLLSLVVLVLSYVIGSIPFGMIIVRLRSGKDLRQVESGRTGGTNAMRAAGFWAGAATAILDLLKATITVYIARWVAPQGYWLHILAPTAAVLGHNYSIFLRERGPDGKLRLRGGAGGASAVGGAFGLWPWSIVIVIPVGLIFLFGVGYASLATLSVALTATLLFIYLALINITPWAYVFYGPLVGLLLVWALRPNIRRLMNGTERLVGWRARRKQQKQSNSNNTHRQQITSNEGIK